MLDSIQNLNAHRSSISKVNFHSHNHGLKAAPELRHLIHESVALLGHVIKQELGVKGYEQIENIRAQMTKVREASNSEAFAKLSKLKLELEKANPNQRYQIAHAFTLMIQLMNTAENAYRSYRLKVNKKTKSSVIHPESITYVLTAHPTEARSAQNIAVFHEIQKILIDILETNAFENKLQIQPQQKEDLLHFLFTAWRIPVMRLRSPKVKDEAETLYSQLFRESILTTLMNANERKVKFRVHSWIGSDKDGHPGVHEKTLLQSLTLSRNEILKLINEQLIAVRATLKLISKAKNNELTLQINHLITKMRRLRVLKRSDAKKIENFKHEVSNLFKTYQKQMRGLHPELRTLSQLLELFPGLVIPMELRESSDVIMSRPKKNKTLAIDRMLKLIASISHGGDPRWYACSFIISMTESATHLKTAALKQKKYLGKIILPVVPLFEEASSLAASAEIMNDVFKDKILKTAIKTLWNSKVELMVGYSDSSKEAGVFPSRFAIAQALPRLEKVCRDHQVIPIFFHGSGGSIDRGGGTFDNQTAWWPKSAVNNFKVTVQGEMIERWLATPKIAERQLENISRCGTDVLKKKYHPPENEDLQNFSDKITNAYRAKTTDPEFLQIIKLATPYTMMRYLKLGSRPARRTKELTVKGLRAIPWILCWTQTRLLFPIWWGAGSAWEQSTSLEKKALLEAFEQNPVFNSYVKALDFTLAKVELAVFKTYLNSSSLPKEITQRISQEIELEYLRTVRFCKTVMKSQKLLDNKLWLQESVHLRAPMIHPLNVLQTIAMKNKEIDLLRLTVTGISSGMMSTG
ncbi:phosphoenolpyruvate carboxylase [Bdellovibrio sp. qaytius]|nr:phosphoenolpyruvate carboxylase [Bdellovibrio sp. qaytius]